MDNPEQNIPQQTVEDKKYKLKCEIEYTNTVLDTLNNIIYKLIITGSFEPDMINETLSTLASHAMDLTRERDKMMTEQYELEKDE